MKKLKGSSPSPLAIGRHYRWSQYSTRAISTGDPATRIKNIFICLILTLITCIVAIAFQVVALSGNYWGYYDFLDHGANVESGSFGLWTICVKNVMDIEISDCGLEDINGRRLTLPAWFAIAGICGGLAAGFLLVCLIVAALQIVQILRGEPTMCANRRALSQKILPAMLALSCSSGCIIFAFLGSRRVRSASITLGCSFYIQVAVISTSVIVLICTAMESFWRPYPSPKRTLLENRLEEASRLKPKQSFFPRDTSIRVEELDVVMNPRADQHRGQTNGNGHSNSVKTERVTVKSTIYRRSYSEGASALQ